MGYFLLMLFLGIILYLYGMYVYYSRSPYIPIIRINKSKIKERKAIGRSLRVISVSPLLSAFIALLGDNTQAFIFSWFILLITFIIALGYIVSIILED